MRIFMIGGLVLIAWLGIGAYWHTCQIKCLCDVDATASNAQHDAGSTSNRPSQERPQLEMEAPATEWIAYRDAQPLFSVPGVPGLQPNSQVLSMDGKSGIMLDSLGQFMRNHPKQSLEISGYYRASEENTTRYPNLGLARAANMRTLLYEYGMDTNRMVLRSKLVRENQQLGLGLNFEASELAAIDNDIRNKVLYSQFGSTSFDSDPELDSYAEQLKGYLTRHPHEVVTLTGHTDNVGQPDANMKLGKERALKVKEYLVRKGIADNQIATSSKGETKPIGSNDTEAGRKLNRRIEISIQ